MNFLRITDQSEASDEELLNRFLQDNNLKTLAQLYDRYIEHVYGVCLKYFKEEERSKDAVMQIFEMLIQKLPGHQVKNFRSWLYVVSKNYCLQELRKGTKNIAPLSDLIMHLDGMLHHDKEFELVDEYGKLYKCIHGLPTEQKRCIELFYFEGLSYIDIAQRLEVPRDRVRSYIQNGRRNLRNCLDGER